MSRNISEKLSALNEEITSCRACPRLVKWREKAALEKRAAFRGEEYWGKPVPGFGDAQAGIVVLGLAPAAHGANRTGRFFTGDRSADFLIASMYRTGFANQPNSDYIGDGLRLYGAWISAAVRCAPPQNKPTAGERDACLSFLERELEILDPTAVVCLGGFAWEAAIRLLRIKPKPRFSHGANIEAGDFTLIGCYHPSQQNTFTGVLKPRMMDEVFLTAKNTGRLR